MILIVLVLDTGQKGNEKMQVAQLTKYDKHNLKLEMVAVAPPQIADHEVLVKVTAAGVNPLDNLISRGEIKLLLPYKLPQTAGNEMVGIIKKVGKNVTNFKTGDRIFARLPLAKIGAFAEYVAVDAKALAKVPAYLSDIEAAAVPLTALTIMQAFELMNIQAGKTIFISGGTGGVGAMAIPLAKAKGLLVITNGNALNAERVLKLGADQFLDYKTQDYTQELSDVDYVLDTLGGTETEKQMSVMKKGGRLASLRGMPNGEFAKRTGLPKWKQLLLGVAGHKYDKLATKYGVHYYFMNVESNGAQLQEVAEIFNRKQIKPSIDTVYPFEQVNEALEKVDRGHSKGKTVLTFSDVK